MFPSTSTGGTVSVRTGDNRNNTAGSSAGSDKSVVSSNRIDCVFSEFYVFLVTSKFNVLRTNMIKRVNRLAKSVSDYMVETYEVHRSLAAFPAFVNGSIVILTRNETSMESIGGSVPVQINIPKLGSIQFRFPSYMRMYEIACMKIEKRARIFFDAIWEENESSFRTLTSILMKIPGGAPELKIPCNFAIDFGKILESIPDDRRRNDLISIENFFDRIGYCEEDRTPSVPARALREESSDSSGSDSSTDYEADSPDDNYSDYDNYTSDESDLEEFSGAQPRVAGVKYTEVLEIQGVKSRLRKDRTGEKLRVKKSGFVLGSNTSVLPLILTFSTDPVKTQERIANPNSFKRAFGEWEKDFDEIFRTDPNAHLRNPSLRSTYDWLANIMIFIIRMQIDRRKFDDNPGRKNPSLFSNYDELLYFYKVIELIKNAAVYYKKHPAVAQSTGDDGSDSAPSSGSSSSSSSSSGSSSGSSSSSNSPSRPDSIPNPPSESLHPDSDIDDDIPYPIRSLKIIPLLSFYGNFGTNVDVHNLNPRANSDNGHKNFGVTEDAVKRGYLEGITGFMFEITDDSDASRRVSIKCFDATAFKIPKINPKDPQASLDLSFQVLDPYGCLNYRSRQIGVDIIARHPLFGSEESTPITDLIYHMDARTKPDREANLLSYRLRVRHQTPIIGIRPFTSVFERNFELPAVERHLLQARESIFRLVYLSDQLRALVRAHVIIFNFILMPTPLGHRTIPERFSFLFYAALKQHNLSDTKQLRIAVTRLIDGPSQKKKGEISSSSSSSSGGTGPYLTSGDVDDARKTLIRLHDQYVEFRDNDRNVPLKSTFMKDLNEFFETINSAYAGLEQQASSLAKFTLFTGNIVGMVYEHEFTDTHDPPPGISNSDYIDLDGEYIRTFLSYLTKTIVQYHLSLEKNPNPASGSAGASGTKIFYEPPGGIKLTEHDVAEIDEILLSAIERRQLVVSGKVEFKPYTVKPYKAFRSFENTLPDEEHRRSFSDRYKDIFSKSESNYPSNAVRKWEIPVVKNSRFARMKSNDSPDLVLYTTSQEAVGWTASLRKDPLFKTFKDPSYKPSLRRGSGSARRLTQLMKKNQVVADSDSDEGPGGGEGSGIRIGGVPSSDEETIVEEETSDDDSDSTLRHSETPADPSASSSSSSGSSSSPSPIPSSSLVQQTSDSPDSSDLSLIDSPPPSSPKHPSQSSPSSSSSPESTPEPEPLPLPPLPPPALVSESSPPASPPPPPPPLPVLESPPPEASAPAAPEPESSPSESSPPASLESAPESTPPAVSVPTPTPVPSVPTPTPELSVPTPTPEPSVPTPASEPSAPPLESSTPATPAPSTPAPASPPATPATPVPAPVSSPASPAPVSSPASPAPVSSPASPAPVSSPASPAPSTPAPAPTPAPTSTPASTPTPTPAPAPASESSTPAPASSPAPAQKKGDKGKGKDNGKNDKASEESERGKRQANVRPAPESAESAEVEKTPGKREEVAEWVGDEGEDAKLFTLPREVFAFLFRMIREAIVSYDVWRDLFRLGLKTMTGTNEGHNTDFSVVEHFDRMVKIMQDRNADVHTLIYGPNKSRPELYDKTDETDVDFLWSGLDIETLPGLDSQNMELCFSSSLEHRVYYPPGAFENPVFGKWYTMKLRRMCEIMLFAHFPEIPEKMNWLREKQLSSGISHYEFKDPAGKYGADKMFIDVFETMTNALASYSKLILNRFIAPISRFVAGDDGTHCRKFYAHCTNRFFLIDDSDNQKNDLIYNLAVHCLRKFVYPDNWLRITLRNKTANTMAFHALDIPIWCQQSVYIYENSGKAFRFTPAVGVMPIQDAFDLDIVSIAALFYAVSELTDTDTSTDIGPAFLLATALMFTPDQCVEYARNLFSTVNAELIDTALTGLQKDPAIDNPGGEISPDALSGLLEDQLPPRFKKIWNAAKIMYVRAKRGGSGENVDTGLLRSIIGDGEINDFLSDVGDRHMPKLVTLESDYNVETRTFPDGASRQTFLTIGEDLFGQGNKPFHLPALIRLSDPERAFRTSYLYRQLDDGYLVHTGTNLVSMNFNQFLPTTPPVNYVPTDNGRVLPTHMLKRLDEIATKGPDDYLFQRLYTSLSEAIPRYIPETPSDSGSSGSGSSGDAHRKPNVFNPERKNEVAIADMLMNWINDVRNIDNSSAMFKIGNIKSHVDKCAKAFVDGESPEAQFERAIFSRFAILYLLSTDFILAETQDPIPNLEPMFAECINFKPGDPGTSLPVLIYYVRQHLDLLHHYESHAASEIESKDSPAKLAAGESNLPMILYAILIMSYYQVDIAGRNRAPMDHQRRKTLSEDAVTAAREFIFDFRNDKLKKMKSRQMGTLFFIRLKLESLFDTDPVLLRNEHEKVMFSQSDYLASTVKKKVRPEYPVRFHPDSDFENREGYLKDLLEPRSGLSSMNYDFSRLFD